MKKGLGLALLGCALLYLPTLKAGFVYDDLWTVLHNPAIRSVAPLSFLLQPQTFATEESQLSFGNFRPLGVLSFSLDYAAWGLAPGPYHLENLLWHLLNGWLAFLLLKRLLGDSRAALLGAAVFLAHPVQVETVAWVNQRTNLLCASGILGGLLLLTRSPLSAPRAIAGLISYSLALLSKEQALVFPFVLAACDWARPPAARGRERVRLYGCVLGVTALYALLRMSLGHPWALSTGQSRWDANFYLAALSFPLYIGKLLLPLALRASYDYPALDAWRVAGGTLFSACYLATTAVVARRDKIAAAALLWVPLTLLPVLHFLPFLVFVAERFLYLPVVGLALGAGWLHARAARARPALYLWLAGLAVATALTVPHWRSEPALWAAAAKAEPTNAFAHMCYAESVADVDVAERHYKLALVNNPSDTVRFAAANNLSWLYFRRRQPKRALIWARAASSQQPRNPAAAFNLARAYAALGDKRRAKETLERLKKLAPADSPMVLQLAQELR